MYIINEISKENAKRVKYMHSIWLSHGTHNDLADARLTIILNEKGSGFFQYYSIDPKWVVNTQYSLILHLRNK